MQVGIVDWSIVDISIQVRILLDKKQQQSLMIRSIRCRPVDKPVITTEIAYNHREEQVDTGSQFSFLKMSENTSKQLSNESDPFTAIQMRIYSVEQRSALRLNQVKRNIMRIQGQHSKERVKIDRDIVEENKENFRVVYRRMPVQDEQSQRIDTSNFQMDENFNYVKCRNKQKQQISDPCDAKTGVTVGLKQFYSLENLRKQEGTKKKEFNRAGSLNSERSFSMKATLKREKVNQKQMGQQKKFLKRSSSSENSNKRGRIYEQILSLYSMSKLLAMQPKLK